MLRSITNKQFIEWRAFAELEPFDETRQDIRTAAVQATMCEMHRDHEKRRKPFTWADFKIPFGDEPKMETPDTLTPQRSSAELKAIVQQYLYGEAVVTDKPRTLRRSRGNG